MSLFLVMLLVGISPTGNYWVSTRPASDAICSFGRRTYVGYTIKTELALANGTVLTNGMLLLNGSSLIDGTRWDGSASKSVGIYSQLLGQYVSWVNGDVMVASPADYRFDPLTCTSHPFVATIINQQTGNIDAKTVHVDSDSSATISMIILIFSFGVRVIKVFRTSSEWLNFKIRRFVSTWLSSRLSQLCTWSNRDDNSIYWKRTLLYRPFLVLFILLRLSLDFYSSLLAEVRVKVATVCYTHLSLYANILAHGSYHMGRFTPENCSEFRAKQSAQRRSILDDGSSHATCSHWPTVDDSLRVFLRTYVCLFLPSFGTQ